MNRLLLSAYRQPQWKEFSRRVIEENQCRCSRCNRHESEGVTLQVHHTYYNPQLFHAPWDYPLSAFEVLCKGCHVKEHGHKMPTEGWEYVEGGYQDMEEPCFPCEYPGCGYELRYVHTIYHPKWGYLNVGCVHADKLTGTEQASKVEEAEKSRQSKFESFLNEKKWQHSGNRYYREYVHFHITITELDGKFRLSIFIPLPDTYQTLLEAQKAAFDMCFNQSPRQFFQQHNIPYPEYEIRKPRSKKNPIIYRFQLTFAISNQTGKLVHIDSVQSDTLCNCVCPACGQPLKADNAGAQPNSHRFLHLNGEQCDNYFSEMYRRLVLQLIEQNQLVNIPAYEEEQAELHIPEHSITIETIQYPAPPFDALVTYTSNNKKELLGILIDIEGTTGEQISKIRNTDISTIKVSLIKQYNSITPLKLKELQELLRTNFKIAKWIHSPQQDQQAQQLIQEKEDFLNQEKSRIQQSINECITEGTDIEKLADTYSDYYKYTKSVKRLFNETIDETMLRIVQEPLPEDIQHTDQCIKMMRWYQLYETKQGIKYELLRMLKQCDFIDLAKQKHNHTPLRFELLRNLFAYYFLYNDDCIYEEWATDKYNDIRKTIQQLFLKHSPLFVQKQKPLSYEQKLGMELCFLLYLYYGVFHFKWLKRKKERMCQLIDSTDNQPIFAAIGTLWFGHIFASFQTDDLQTFIHTIVEQYPQAAPWVLTYIENTNYREYCQLNNIHYKELEQYRNEFYDIWIAGVLYSTLPYYYDKNNNKHVLFPKVTLP